MPGEWKETFGETFKITEFEISSMGYKSFLRQTLPCRQLHVQS